MDRQRLTPEVMEEVMLGDGLQGVGDAAENDQ